MSAATVFAAMGDGIPPILVISLPRAEARRAFSEQAFDQIGLVPEFVPAVDGTLLEVERTAYSKWRAYYEYGRALRGTEIATALSHLEAMGLVVERGLPEAVIFEDDTSPSADLVEILRRRDLLPPDWDVVTFHSLYDWATPEPVADTPIFGEYRVCRFRRTPMGAQAYMVTSAAASRLLSVGQPVGLPSDELIFRPRPAGLVVYGIHPAPVVEAAFPTEARRADSDRVDARGLQRVGLEAARLTGRIGRRVLPRDPARVWRRSRS